MDAATGIALETLREQVQSLPAAPGVYLFKDAAGQILYVGKAADVRKRVSSYFRDRALLPPRIQRMVALVAGLEVRRAASETEALLLEASLIKDLRPKYNVLFRDDKTYPMLKLTRERFPRLLVTRRRQPDGALYLGPFPDATLMHQAVRFMRKVFPMRTCRTFPKTPCLEFHLGQCLAPCVGHIDEAGYRRIVDDLTAFLHGRREELLKDLKRRMDSAARDLRYEEAARLRDQMRALRSVMVPKPLEAVPEALEQMQRALKLPRLPRRMEAFDISNLFGAFAVGSMVVFQDGAPLKAHYRRFKIRTVEGIDDYRMMREVIRRRYSGTLSTELPLPDLILVDGGRGQLSAACEELAALNLALPAIGLAKRFEQIILPEAEQPVVLLSTSPVLHLLQHIRDEAHRFAITYHRRLRDEALTVSRLQEIAGIGPKRAAKLLSRFGSAARLSRATSEQVSREAGLSLEQAAAVIERVKQFQLGMKPLKEIEG